MRNCTESGTWSNPQVECKCKLYLAVWKRNKSGCEQLIVLYDRNLKKFKALKLPCNLPSVLSMG